MAASDRANGHDLGPEAQTQQVVHPRAVTGDGGLDRRVQSPITDGQRTLTIAELPGLVIFGQTADDALGWAREAIAFQLRDAPDNAQQPALEFVLGRAS